MQINKQRVEATPEYRFDVPEGTTVFEDLFITKLESLRDKYLNETDRYINMGEILEVIRIMQDCKMDCHIAIMGQNGVGKTYLLLMFMKMYLGNKWMQNLLLAKHTTNDFIHFLLTHTNTLLGIDEMNQYLDYKEHLDDEQKHLIRQIELSRDNRVAVIGCVRDARKLTVNYRQGKLSIVIWILDRYTNKGSYAAVFISNPTVESADKFGLSLIAGDIINFNDLRWIIEDKMYSFVGYMKVPNVNTLLDAEEIREYEEEKRMAKMFAHINHIFSQYKKRRIYIEEVMQELERAKIILGDAIVADLTKKIPEPQSHSKKKKAIEDD